VTAEDHLSAVEANASERQLCWVVTRASSEAKAPMADGPEGDRGLGTPNLRHRGYFLNGRTAPARPGWVEVIGRVALTCGCPPAVPGCGSHLACGLPVTVARLWLQRGLPSSK
jgi:hypothetical protein